MCAISCTTPYLHNSTYSQRDKIEHIEQMEQTAKIKCLRCSTPWNIQPLSPEQANQDFYSVEFTVGSLPNTSVKRSIHPEQNPPWNSPARNKSSLGEIASTPASRTNPPAVAPVGPAP